MKSLTKLWGIIAVGTALALSVAGCATTVPIKSVRMPTINGMDAIRSLGISNFENKSGVRGSVGAQLTQYLTDKAKQMIPATGKFNVVAAVDPNADGVFFGELRSITSEDSETQRERKDQEGNTYIETTYTRKVSVEFVYGVRSSRTGGELGTVTKQGSTGSSSTESVARLTDTLTLARSIVDSKMKDLTKDLVPTIVSTNRKLVKETSKDKVLKQLMKDVLVFVRNGNYHEAISQYDDIYYEYGSAAAMTNAGILRQSVASDAAASAQMAQLDSERIGLAGRAVKNAVDALNSKLPSGAIIIIMKTRSTERAMLNDVVDQITMAIVQAGNLKVVDRSSQALIDAEQIFQLSGNVDDKTAISVGHQLGARYTVLCWISGASSGRKLNLRLLDIETAQIVDQTSFDI
jgi:TolB-like protein